MWRSAACAAARGLHGTQLRRATTSGYYSEASTPDRTTVASGNRKELKTDFVQTLHTHIQASGYLSLTQFMKECLTHPDYGYYSTKKSVIGTERADFLTAAEIPLFGDIVCGWIIDTWQKMGTPRAVHLVEVGPGKGTLMRNVLRQVKHTQPQLLNFLTVHLCEVGEARREEQRKTLSEFQTAQGRIKWVNSFDDFRPVPGQATIFLANEWLDALPIMRFTQTEERGLVETVLEIDDEPHTVPHFRYVHAPGQNWNRYLIPEDITDGSKFPLGDGSVEICSHGMAAMESLATKLHTAGKGAALLIDYGKDEHMSSTLRGIRGHKFVDPLLSPGDVDLSAWVSFKQLKWALSRLPLARQTLKWHGPMSQADFLEWNGIDVRLASAIKSMETKQAQRLKQNFLRLMDPKEMGITYQVMAVQTNNFATVAPWF